MYLTPAQSEAIVAEGHTLVTACPGAGKTHVIIERSAQLLSNQTNNLALVTFTRSAADEMKLRISKRVQTQRAQINTFHGFACRQYRTLKNANKIANNFEIRNMIWSAMRITSTYLDYEAAVDVIEEFNAQLYPNKLELEVERKEDWELFSTYRRLLKTEGLTDFSGVSRSVVIGMREGKVHPLPVSHLLVDEFQDVDALQLAWVEEHIKRGSEITVVADDDQSIYAFRRSLGYEGIEKFIHMTHPNHLILDTCFRCPPQVTDQAMQLISFNTRRVQKTIKSHKDNANGQVTHVQCDTEKKEAETVTTVAAHLDGELAVLARRNNDLDEVESMLQAHNLPCVRITGKPFWENETAAMYLALLMSALDKDYSHGISAILIHLGERQDRIKTYTDNTQANGFSLAEVSIGSGYSRNVCSLHQCLNETYTAYQSNNIELASQGLAIWLIKTYKKTDKGSALQRRQHTTQIAADAISSLEGDLLKSIQRLQSQHRRPEKKHIAPGTVQLGTFHSAKGLEFENVWLIRANNFNEIEIEIKEIEEERRLFYVAMTRTKNQLYVSTTSLRASMFVYEAGLLRAEKRINYA